jgi:hypothetical protein
VTPLLIIGALVGGWAVLAVLSGERERRLAEPDDEPTPPKSPEPTSPPARPKKDSLA